jgi:hypothetical protein
MGMKMMMKMKRMGPPDRRYPPTTRPSAPTVKIIG